MFLRIVFYSILFYFIFRIIRWFKKVNDDLNKRSGANPQNKSQQNKTYNADEIQDAEYEEIE